MVASLRQFLSLVFRPHKQGLHIGAWQRLQRPPRIGGAAQRQVFRLFKPRFLRVLHEVFAPLDFGAAQALLKIPSAGQQPQGVRAHPLFQTRPFLIGAAGHQTQIPLLQRPYHGCLGKLAHHAPLKQPRPASAHGLPSLSILPERADGEQCHLVNLAHGTLSIGIKYPHLVHSVAKKFNAHRAVVAGGQHIQNIAAPGHVTRAGNHAFALVAPFDKLLQYQLRREFLIFANDDFPFLEKVHGRQKGQQVIRRQDYAPACPPSQSVERGHTACPPLTGQGAMIERRQTNPRPFPKRPLRNGVPAGNRGIGPAHGHLGRKKSDQAAHEGQFLAGTHHQGHTPPVAHGLTCETRRSGGPAAADNKGMFHIEPGKQS